MSLDWLPGLDLAGGTFTLPLWAAGLLLALLVALIVIAVLRAGLSELGSMVFRVAIILIAVGFGWTYLARTGDRDRHDERRALDARSADLVARAIAPGSAIACLEATNTETVEGSCERAVFASPETVAAATAYMAARISLLVDAHEFNARANQSYETQIAGLRRTVAADRYGLASQVLSVRDGCTADACDAFGLLYDDKKIKANLRDRLFDVTVARYAVNWPSRGRPLASGGSSGSGSPSFAFPSAASMSPVSSPAEPASSSPPPSASAPPSSQTASPAPEPTPSSSPSPTNSAPASATKRATPPPQQKAATKSNAAPPPMSLNPAPKQ